MYQLVRRGDHFEMVEKRTATPGADYPDLTPLHKATRGLWKRCPPTERRAWDHYVRHGTVDRKVVRHSILQSWERCTRAGVDPAAGWGSDFADFGDLEKTYGHLLEASVPITETLYQCVRGTGMVIVLTAPGGYILQTLGDTDTLRRADELNFGPGANWSEASVGTNAIGTALALRRPIEVTGTEHFCETHHLWTCSAAPILDPHGNLLGCLDISGPRENAHPHIMGMVLAAVRSIENRLGLQLSHGQLEEAHQQLLAVLDTVADGIVTVGADGRITNLNSAAADLLGLDREEIVGRPAPLVLGPAGDFDEILKRGTVCAERELVLKTRTDRVECTATARPFQYGNARATGAVIALRGRKRQLASAKPRPSTTARYTFDDIVGRSRAFRDVVQRAKTVAASPSTVLLLGESGTGKELFAQAIHNASDRHDGPFVAVNCAAIPRDLIQSELFGYEAGAFTGAHRGGRAGKFESSHGGTLFLDEIGDMPLEMQSNLLRVLEERVVVRVGGSKATPVDVRLIAATHRDLLGEVEKRAFRKDLYYRLSVITVRLPPLRDRPQDVIPLAERHLARLSSRLGRHAPSIHPDVMESLAAHSWPGNVRELMNVIEQAVNLAQGEAILVEHLPQPIRGLRPGTATPPVSMPVTGEIAPLASVEKWAIEQAIVRYRGNLTKVAKALGIGRNTLYEKIKKHAIRR